MFGLLPTLAFKCQLYWFASVLFKRDTALQTMGEHRAIIP